MILNNKFYISYEWQSIHAFLERFFILYLEELN